MSVKFVIVSAPRTGSTLLVKTLNSLPDVRCHGELLNLGRVAGLADGFDALTATQPQRDARNQHLAQLRKQDPVKFVQDALSYDDAATGLKVLYLDFYHPPWKNAIDSILAMDGVKFIHLTRRNTLRRYVSEQILYAGGPNHSLPGGRSENRLKVDIDIDAYLQRTAEIKTTAKQVASALENYPVLDIVYENLADRPGETIMEICHFLGLSISAEAVTPALTKVGANDLRETVNNYQDLLENEITRALLASA